MPRTLASYLARRVVAALLTLWLVSVLIFALMEVLPGDVASLRVGPFATPEQVADARRELGLDRPIYVRYADWAIHVLQGDLGESWRFGIPIAPLVSERLVNSLYLAGVAFVAI